MVVPELTIPKYVSLKNHPNINEKWLEDRLIENTELLGLGELDVLTRQRTQPSGGILDLLLSDSEKKIWYEIEIQLGATDESHIIRTIEYWDVERRRYPQYEHIAVIVAEEVTGRFLNVISLFNGTIPLMAIQLKGVEVNGAFTLVATRVLDAVRPGTEVEIAGESVNRTFWEQKPSAGSLTIVDNVISLINVEVVQGVEARYNKHFIGLTHNGQARNFVIFNPTNAYVRTGFKIPENEEMTTWLNNTGLDVLPYDSTFNYYRVRIRRSDLEAHREDLLKLIKEAREAYFGS